MSTTASPEAPTLPPLPNHHRTPTRRSPLRLASRGATIATVAAVVVAMAYFGWKSLGVGVRTIEKPLAVAAHRATLRVVVTERGNLESTVTVDGICEMTGHQNKIIQ